ncbi:MAG: TIM barrel protein [Acidobacteriota bacterium]|nr:TIM barrel protein [Acidobacteriota bacterium]
MSLSLSRRRFLQSSAFAGAATSVACAGFLSGISDAAQSNTKTSDVRLGLASYTFRNFDRAQVIAWMKELKLDQLNAKDTKDHLPSDPAAEAAAVADYKANGIHLHAAGTIYLRPGTEEVVRSKFEYCKRAGIGVMVAGDPTEADLPLIQKMVREYDIRVAIHNHGPEDKLWPSPLDVLKSVEKYDHRIGCCIDVGHTERAGTDVIEAIHKVGPRLYNMHMKDLTDFHSKESQVAVGEGKMPIRGIFAALQQIGYKGFVDLEYEVHGDDPMPGVRESFAYMRGVLAGMA